MKVLVITYYWPPAGGSGVQRWLKFVKYLREFGVEPIIYTVDQANYPILDESLHHEIPENLEVLKQPIWEPNKFFNKSSKKTSAGFLDANPSFLGRIAHYIRANYFIPDARKFWINPSIKYLLKYLQEHPVDVLITTGPPHSLHLIGLGLKKKLNIKWMADFRDPWTQIDYFHQLPLTKRSVTKHHELEQKVLTNADAVVVVGKTMAAHYKNFTNKIHVITNGFDSAELNDSVHLDQKFSLVHVGMMNTDRNHEILWQALKELTSENESFASDLHLKFIGKVSAKVLQSVQNYHLERYTEFIDYLEHHLVTKHQQSAQILLLSVNNVPSAKGIITGKIFEYLHAKRPILALAPKDGDLSEILKSTNAGVTIDFNDKEKLKAQLLDFYTRFKSQSLHSESTNIEQYHRKNLTKELVEILKEL
ncbi:MAG: glycosyltransferase family 4 protein [Flavobacteriaceae bacterium]|nr:glycosyltransferase family 4 protein [Flavobacteriaceae bacterium]